MSLNSKETPMSDSRLSSGILDTRSNDLESEFSLSGSDFSPEDESFEDRPPRLSGRGALISGRGLGGDERRKKVSQKYNDDLESGADSPPNSDYAPYVPPSLFPMLDAIRRKTKESPAGEDPVSYDNDRSDFGSGSTPSWWDEKHKRPSLWYILAFATILMIAGVIGLAVVMANRDDMTSQQKQIKDVATSISDKALLEDSATPQAQAYKWLMDNDAYFANNAITRAMAMQRYVLGVFYFATGGAHTWLENNWLDGAECSSEWTGITCNELGEVKTIVFDNNGLSGFIPTEFGHLSAVEHVVLKNNIGLTGSLPPTLGKMRRLRQLGLYNNNLQGAIPNEIYAASNLRYLNLESNDLTGTLSSQVGNLVGLTTLALANNHLDGFIPFDGLARTSIEYLGLSSNKFSGPIGDSIRDCKSLKYMYLDRNELNGVLSVSLGSAENLRSINLDLNSFSGRIPAAIGRLKMLEYLSMQSNSLVGALPGEISLLTNLKTLNLVSNSLTGILPDLTPLKKLNNLLLVGNNFVGQIEDHFVGMNSLEILFLSDNAFTGPIPTLVGTANGADSSLRGLYLSQNKLTGMIPETICSHASLEALFLDENQLSGSLPPCLGKLEKLKQLFVFKNGLSGSLPVELSNLRQLTGMGLEHNSFVGNVPNAICTRIESSNATMATLWADCGGSVPEVACPCCDVCCPSEDCT